MKCSDFQDLVLEYLDGELEEELSAGMQMHLGNCPACSTATKALISERSLYQGYRARVEGEMDPAVRVWPGIQARISAEAGWKPAAHPADIRYRYSLRHKMSVYRQLAYAAALVVITVAATLFSVRFFTPDAPRSADVRPPSADPAAVTAVSLPASGERSLEGALRAIQRAEGEYLEAIRVLSEIVDKRKSALPPSLVQELDRNLKSIDEGIDAARRAYLAHQSDPYLAQYMLTAYSKKVELLQEMAGRI